MSISNDGSEPIAEGSEADRLLRRPALARDLGQSTRPATDRQLPQSDYQPADAGQEPFQQAYLTPDQIVASVNGSANPRKPGILERWRAKGGILGTIATIIIFLLKVGAPFLFLLGKIKVFGLLIGSMLLSIWLESRVFGWELAVGIVMLIFIHECGHALAAKLRGIPTGIMVFVPFMGAFVTTKRYGRNLEEDAFIGIMGPIVGSIASAIAASFFFINRNPFWLVLGQWGLFINLFNLLPTPPLDGGWIAPLFSPKLLAIGVILGVIAGYWNWMIWILLLISIPRIVAGWRADPKTQPYYQVSTAAKWKYGILYFGLAALLLLGSTAVGKIMVA